MKRTEKIDALLSRCLGLLAKYETALNAALPAGYSSRLMPELRERLQLLYATFGKIVALVGPAADATSGLAGVLHDEEAGCFIIDFSNTLFNPRAVDRQAQLDLELFSATEMFYHTAWRLREMLHRKDCGLPGLCGFDAPGVRRVRNHLIQHPEQPQNGIVVKRSWSRGLSKTTGPSLGGAYEGPPAEVYADPGLYANAAEFAEELERMLVAELRRRGVDATTVKADRGADLRPAGSIRVPVAILAVGLQVSKDFREATVRNPIGAIPVGQLPMIVRGVCLLLYIDSTDYLGEKIETKIYSRDDASNFRELILAVPTMKIQRRSSGISVSVQALEIPPFQVRNLGFQHFDVFVNDELMVTRTVPCYLLG